MSKHTPHSSGEKEEGRRDSREERDMMFYTYMQNNSGGDFHFDAARGVSHYVIIEAASAEEANKKALDIGLYFDGCDDGRDCPCCGDRWYPQDDGIEVPEVYGQSALKVGSVFRCWMEPNPEGFIHYANGKIKAIKAKKISMINEGNL